MKGYVIHLPKSKKSSKSANDVITSVHMNTQIECELWGGVDKYDSWKTITDMGFEFDSLSFGGGDVPVEMGTFLSHYSLWEKCVSENTSIVIFEDDAMCTTSISFNISEFTGDVLNLGRPNWGLKYKNEHEAPIILPTDSKKGIILRDVCLNNHNSFADYNKLSTEEQSELCDCDSQWLFGAHSYIVTPKGAEKLMKESHNKIKPADIFINQSIVDIYDLHPLSVKQIGNGTLIQPSPSDNWDY